MSNVAIPRGFNRPTVPWKSFLKLRFRLWPFSILNVMGAFPFFYNHGERKFFLASKKDYKIAFRFAFVRHVGPCRPKNVLKKN